MISEYVVIVAGGSGTRMQSTVPKQFIEIGGLPILMHTILSFKQYSANIQIVLVLPKTQFDYWDGLCNKHMFDTKNIWLVAGGASRFQSCKNGIESIVDEQAIIAIHDGVRPFVTSVMIKNGFDLARLKGTAVCSISSKDSIRYIEPNGKNIALNRQQVKLIQTPQIFQKNILNQAYGQPESEAFTDDASVVEAAGYTINLYEGAYENIKITTSSDLLVAEQFLKNRENV